MKLIVGLGNPGKKYEKTRHNVGFLVLDYFLGNIKWQEKFNGLYYKTIIDNESVIFLKPLTYMNLSGDSVREFVDYYDVSIDDILVVQDDLDQLIGDYKLKKNSSSGGHNGINSIISSLNSDSFLRLKIGIKNEFTEDAIDFVLSKFSRKDFAVLKGNFDIFNDIINSFIIDGTDKTMNIYNKRK